MCSANAWMSENSQSEEQPNGRREHRWIYMFEGVGNVVGVILDVTGELHKGFWRLSRFFGVRLNTSCPIKDEEIRCSLFCRRSWKKLTLVWTLLQTSPTRCWTGRERSISMTWGSKSTLPLHLVALESRDRLFDRIGGKTFWIAESTKVKKTKRKQRGMLGSCGKNSKTDRNKIGEDDSCGDGSAFGIQSRAKYFEGFAKRSVFWLAGIVAVIVIVCVCMCVLFFCNRTRKQEWDPGNARQSLTFEAYFSTKSFNSGRWARTWMELFR